MLVMVMVMVIVVPRGAIRYKDTLGKAVISHRHSRLVSLHWTLFKGVWL